MRENGLWLGSWREGQPGSRADSQFWLGPKGGGALLPLESTERGFQSEPLCSPSAPLGPSKERSAAAQRKETRFGFKRSGLCGHVRLPWCPLFLPGFRRAPPGLSSVSPEAGEVSAPRWGQAPSDEILAAGTESPSLLSFSCPLRTLECQGPDAYQGLWGHDWRAWLTSRGDTLHPAGGAREAPPLTSSISQG